MVMLKRKRQGKTDYRKRLRLLKSGQLRLVVRKSNKNIIMQIIEYEKAGDKIILSAHTNELAKLGWNCAKKNIPAAYLTGLLIGRKAKDKNIESAILDIGLNKSVNGSLIYAALKGAVDGGLKIAHSKEVYPSDDRINGSHIANNDKTKFKYNNKEIQKYFDDVKNKILKGQNG